jgi:hypothetical protein
MYEHTPNLKHTIANKGSMKALQGFIQMEMKDHDHGEIYIYIYIF